MYDKLVTIPTQYSLLYTKYLHGQYFILILPLR